MDFFSNVIKYLPVFLLHVISFSAFAISAHSPVLNRQGSATQLVVDGSPFLILGGELGNSSASSPDDIERIFPKLRDMGLNTVLVPMYWDLLEPVEGEFDFSLSDKVITDARANDLKVIFLWFGAWKNSMSCYAPEWFKRDYERFPRAHTHTGKPLEIASAFSENVFEADNKAFTTWLRYLSLMDAADHTVIMIQVENEIGMLEDARDYSDVATRLYHSAVPGELLAFLQANTDTLHPSLAFKFDNGPKSGTWAEVFGDDIFTEEIFSAYYYAKYVERMAQSAIDIMPIPYYVNAAMNSRGRLPGQYPSAGPLAHLKDIWHAAAPSLLCLAPDLYDSGFTDWVAQYALPDNPLFIPEIQRSDANGAQALYVFGEKDAIGFSPFSIEDGEADPRSKQVMAYSVLNELMPIITKYQGRGVISGLYFDNDNTERLLLRDGMKITCRHFFTLPWDPRATDGSKWPVTGAMLIRIAPEEYILAGNGVVVQFENEGENLQSKSLGEDGFELAGDGRPSTSADVASNNTSRVGIAYCDEVTVSPDGKLNYVRRLNGDQDHQGRHVRIGVDDFKILHVKLYQYR